MAYYRARLLMKSAMSHLFNGKEIFLPDFQVFYAANNPPKLEDDLSWHYGGTTVVFQNNSNKTLYAYHALGDMWTSIHCSALGLRESDPIRPGGRWSYRVLNTTWVWFRFQENTEGSGCPDKFTRFEKNIVGTALPKTIMIEIK